MSEPNTVVLEITPLRYYSQYNETVFFEWLGKLKCVSKYEGRGRILYVEIQSSAVDETELLEMMALFSRYNIDNMKQLAVFDREDFSEWFHNNKANWFT